MGLCLGGLKEDVTRANRWILALKKCGMGVMWDQWPSSYSEVPKPR